MEIIVERNKKLRFVCKLTKSQLPHSYRMLKEVDWDINKFARELINGKWSELNHFSISSIEEVNQRYHDYLREIEGESSGVKGGDKEGVYVTTDQNKLVSVRFSSASAEAIVSSRMKEVIGRIVKEIFGLSPFPSDIFSLLKSKIQIVEGEKKSIFFEEWVRQLGKINFKENLVITHYECITKNDDEYYSIFNQSGFQTSSFCVFGLENRENKINIEKIGHIAAHILAAAKEVLKGKNNVFIGLNNRKNSFGSKEERLLENILSREFLYDDEIKFRDYLEKEELKLTKIGYISVS